MLPSNGTLQVSKTWRRMIESDRAVSKTWSQLEWFTRNISEWWKLVWAKASQGSWNRWKTLLIWTNSQSNVSNHIQSILCSVYLDFTITTSHLNTSLVLPFVKCYAIRYSCVCPFSFCSEWLILIYHMCILFMIIYHMYIIFLIILVYHARTSLSATNVSYVHPWLYYTCFIIIIYQKSNLPCIILIYFVCSLLFMTLIYREGNLLSTTLIYHTCNLPFNFTSSSTVHHLQPENFNFYTSWNEQSPVTEMLSESQVSSKCNSETQAQQGHTTFTYAHLI